MRRSDSMGSRPGSAGGGTVGSPTYLHPSSMVPPMLSLPPAAVNGMAAAAAAAASISATAGSVSPPPTMLVDSMATAPLRRKRSRIAPTSSNSGSSSAGGSGAANGNPGIGGMSTMPSHISDALLSVLLYCSDQFGPLGSPSNSVNLSSSSTSTNGSLSPSDAGPYLHEHVLKDGAQPILVYRPQQPLDPNVECFVLLNCPVEQHPARKNHGQNATVDYQGRYWANFTHLCHLGIFPTTNVNNLDKTLRWTNIPAILPALAHPNFPWFYCKDTIAFYKILKNNVMVLALTINRSGMPTKTYYDKKDRSYHGDLLPYHIILRIENVPSMPKTSYLPPLPIGIAPALSSRQNSSDSLVFMNTSVSDSDYTDDEGVGDGSIEEAESASSLYNLLLTANSRTASSSNLEAMGKEDHHDQPPHVTQIDLERAAILMVSDTYQKFWPIVDRLSYSSIDAMNTTVSWPHSALEATQHKLLHKVSGHPIVQCIPALPMPFIGRFEVVEKLAQALLTKQPDSTTAKVMWLYGEAGVGKSAVAAAVGRLCIALNEHAYPSGVFYSDVAFLRRTHIVNGIISRIHPQGLNVDEFGMNVWAASITSPSLVIVDNLERVEKLPSDGLEWLWSCLESSQGKLTVIVTCRDPCPPVRPSASVEIIEQHLDRLSTADAESLMYSLAQDADVAEISLAGGIRGPDLITRLAAGVRMQKFARLRLPSTPDNLAPSGAAGLALVVFDGVFDEEAAHAVMGTHEITSPESPFDAANASFGSPVSKETRASLLALCSEGAIVVVNADKPMLRWSPRWHAVFSSAAARVPTNLAHAQDRLVHYSLKRLVYAAMLWLHGQEGPALAIVDHDMPYLTKILLHTEVRPEWLPIFLDVLLAAWPLLSGRFDHREFLRLSERIEGVVVSQSVLSPSDILLLVAVCDVYAKDFADAFQTLSTLSRTDIRVTRLMALALITEGDKMTQEQQYHTSLERYVQGLQLVREAPRSQIVLAALLERVATAQVTLGMYDVAVQNANEALNILLKNLGKNHPSTGWCFAILAGAHEGLGDHQAALNLFKNSLEVLTQALGARHPKAATVVHNIGALHATMQEYSIALKYHEDALQRRTSVLGPDHLDTAVSHYNCALLLTLLNMYDKAVAHHQIALRVRSAKLGSDHPLTQEVVQQLVAITTTEFADKVQV